MLGYLMLSLLALAAVGVGPLLGWFALFLVGVTQTLTLNWNQDSTQIKASVSITQDGDLGYDGQIPAPSTDMQINMNMVVAKINMIYILSDQDLTIETNSGTTPATTLAVLAGKPVVWYTGCGLANPFTVNITAFFITKGAGT